MKTLRYIFAWLTVMLASTMSAQVVEYHLNPNLYGPGQVSKDYLHDIDSLVYVPAQNWGAYIETESFYVDSLQQVHAIVRAEVGPDAVRSRVYFGDEGLSLALIQADSLDYRSVPTGTSYLDYILPDPTTPYTVWLYNESTYHGYYYWWNYVDAREFLRSLAWQDMGMATYRDDLITSIFSIENITYNVPIQQNSSQPGLYRLVNPYGVRYPYNEEGDYDTSEDHYMVIHAEDPAHVWVEEMSSGMNWGYGEFLFTSWVARYLEANYTLEDIIAVCPDDFGTLENGIITMPKNSMIVAMREYNKGNWSFYGSPNGLFAVALPGYALPDTASDSIPTTRAKAQAPRRIQNMDGPNLPRTVTAVKKAAPTPLNRKPAPGSKFRLNPVGERIKQ